MAHFNTNLIDFNPVQTDIFNRVCITWGATLQNNININIQAQFVAFPDGLNHLNAMCVPNFTQGAYFGINSTATTAQAKALGVANFPLPPAATMDMVVLINQNYADDFNYTMDETDETNFYTLCLHEICHGLGFVGLCNVREEEDVWIGIFTDTALLNALALMQAYIPFWDGLGFLLPNYPTLFAQEFQNPESAAYIYNDPPPTVYNFFTTQDSMEINYIGQEVNESYFVYSPPDFNPFSSCDHINYNDCLMYVTIGNNVYEVPDYRTTNILSNIGWAIA